METSRQAQKRNQVSIRVARLRSRLIEASEQYNSLRFAPVFLTHNFTVNATADRLLYHLPRCMRHEIIYFGVFRPKNGRPAAIGIQQVFRPN